MIAAPDYEFLSGLLRAQSGLSLGAGKEYLLESRLPAVVQTFGLQSLDELIALLRHTPHADLVKAVCDAMTTSETLFFRDDAPFELLRNQIIPDAVHRCAIEGRPLRIWSAAAATGQEPYSVAILLHELGPRLRNVRTEIIATDFATPTLNRARRGIYSEIEIRRGLSEDLLRQYFTPVADGYRIADDIRRRVTFRECNLIHSFKSLGAFDVILCRNVLIYFDTELKKDVLDRMADALAKCGVLMLGATETAFNATDKLVRVPDVATPIHMRREDVPNAPPRRTNSGAYPISPR